MNQDQFVEALRVYAADAAVHGVLSQWTSPSGRFPSKERLDRSAWFNSLPEDHRTMVQDLVADTARATLFGVLCILDGARRVVVGEEHFELRVVDDGGNSLLSSSAPEQPVSALHELL
jgi:hypothetical protein